MNLIIGQGIAGSVLALTLLERGQKVIVVDNDHQTSSSTIAAGLWNPIVFRRINKSWRADELLKSLNQFYPRMEKLLDGAFFQSAEILRMHSNDAEASLWNNLPTTADFSPYLLPKGDESNFGQLKKPPFGSGVVGGAGYVNVPVFLDAARRYFERQGLLIESEVDLPQSLEELSAFDFESLKYEHIIDCSGYQAASGHWFGYLPFALAKGEILTIHCPGLHLDRVFNAGFFLLPLGNDLFRLGATFVWSDLNEIPTAAGRSELLEKLDSWLKLPYSVVDHKAGVRPAVVDRRPLIGRHPEAHELFIFNGLGAKGIMLAPLLADEFASFLLDGQSLSPEADIARFRKYYKPRKTAALDKNRGVK